jgi:hypothetical protein
MNIKNSKVLLAVVTLVLTSLACSVPGSRALLQDDFSGESTWGTGTDADSSVEHLNEALKFFVNKDLYFVWSTPNDEDYENVHIEVTANNNSTDATAAFGIICNLQITNTSYYFAVTGAGEYAIGKYTFAGDTLLTNNGQWAESSQITSGADSYRIGADCGNNTLTLYVDGQRIDSVNDSTYTTGNVGLFAWSGERLDGTDVTFDDFVMTTLPPE